MKKLLITLAIIVLGIGIATYAIYHIKPQPMVIKKPQPVVIKHLITQKELRSLIDEYAKEIRVKRTQAQCNLPKNASDFPCMYGIYGKVSADFADRHSEFRAYLGWLSEDVNCNHKTGVCTGLGVIPTPKQMYQDLDRYIRFINQKP